MTIGILFAKDISQSSKLIQPACSIRRRRYFDRLAHYSGGLCAPVTVPRPSRHQSVRKGEPTMPHCKDPSRKNTQLMKWRGILAIFLGCLIIPATNAAAQAGFEPLPILDASMILPSNIVTGPHYKVDKQVRNDGYVNTYTIHSSFGEFEAVSTALLRIRVDEVRAIASMETVKKSDIFGNAMKAAGEGIVNGAASLVTRPVETISGAMTGVGKLFQSSAENIAGGTSSKYEDNGAKSLIGFSSTKRAYAKEFGVDVYSSNPVLQERLNDIAWAGYSGGLSINALTAVIPGGVGVAVSVFGASDKLNDAIASTPPSELRKTRRCKTCGHESG